MYVSSPTLSCRLLRQPMELFGCVPDMTWVVVHMALHSFPDTRQIASAPWGVVNPHTNALFNTTGGPLCLPNPGLWKFCVVSSTRTTCCLLLLVAAAGCCWLLLAAGAAGSGCCGQPQVYGLQAIMLTPCGRSGAGALLLQDGDLSGKHGNILLNNTAGTSESGRQQLTTHLTMTRT